MPKLCTGGFINVRSRPRSTFGVITSLKEKEKRLGECKSGCELGQGLTSYDAMRCDALNMDGLLLVGVHPSLSLDVAINRGKKFFLILFARYKYGSNFYLYVFVVFA